MAIYFENPRQPLLCFRECRIWSILDRTCARFPGWNDNLPNGTCFRHFRGEGTRMKWVPFVAFFSPCFKVFFASKLAISPLRRSVMGAWKGHIRARKGRVVDLGPQDPKTTRNAFKTRENVTTPQPAPPHGSPPNWAQKRHKTGKKARRTNGTYFARPPGGGNTREIGSSSQIEKGAICLIGHPQTCVYPDVCLAARGLVDTQSVCPPALQIAWDKEEWGGASTKDIAAGGGLYQIQCQSVNTHRGKHRPGGARFKPFRSHWGLLD